MRNRVFRRYSTFLLTRDSHDCGPACLTAIAGFYHLHVSIGYVRSLVNPDLQGADLPSLRDAALALGFEASCGKALSRDLSTLPVPAILHLIDDHVGHYVVLIGSRKQGVDILDPFLGLVTLQNAVLDRLWSGFVVLLRPGPSFAPRKLPSRVVREALQTVRIHRRTIIPSVALALSLTAVSIASSFAVKIVIDKLLPTYSARAWWYYFLPFLGLCCYGGFASYGRAELLARLGEQIESVLTMKYVDELFGLPLRYLERRSLGDLLSRTQDVTHIRVMLTSSLLGSVVDIVTLLIASVFLFRINAHMLALTIILISVASVTAYAVAPRIADAERLSRISQTIFSGRLIELLSSIRIVKSVGGEPHAVANLRQVCKDALAATRRRSVLGAALTAFSGAAARITSLLVLFVGVRLATGGSFTPGTLFFFFAVSGLFISSAESLVPAVVSFKEAEIAYERLADIESVPKEPTLLAEPALSEPVRLLECQELDFWHRETLPLLKKISFTVIGPAILCIAGRTGSGKSTLAALLAGLYTPLGGALWLNGVAYEDIGTASVRRTVGVVFQDAGLITGSIRANICLGIAQPDDEALRKALWISGCDEFVNHLPKGVDYIVGAVGVGLSSGQRQRIALARAVMHNPSVLILDEATSHLDLGTESMVLDRILEERVDKITVLISHRASVMARASQVLLLEKGKLVDSGGAEALAIRNGLFKELIHTAQV